MPPPPSFIQFLSRQPSLIIDIAMPSHLHFSGQKRDGGKKNVLPMNSSTSFPTALRSAFLFYFYRLVDSQLLMVRVSFFNIFNVSSPLIIITPLKKF